MAILLMDIGDYSINGYLCLVILLMVIGDYFVINYWWLFYRWLLVIILL